MRKLLHGLASDEQGQAMVEYILMVALAVSVVSIIAVGFRKFLFKMWTMMGREVSSACPGCPADPRINLR